MAAPFALLLPASLCAGAYVLGSIPTGLIIARRRGVDIRTVGSGNIGATNVARALGKRWAIFVLVVDAAKGFGPVFGAERWVTRHPTATAPATLVALVGLCAIVGHMFTIFLRGQGGKGVATSLGVAIGLSPPLALLSLAVYALTYAATRLSSLGSILGIWAFPCIALLFARLPAAYLALSLVSALLVTWRHRTNLRRLLRHEEPPTP
jgi:acyl phosphate:glycerol-3-phosphate acyltransferase